MEYTKVCYLCDSIFMGKTPVYSEEETPYKVLGQKNNQKTGIDLNGIKYLTKDFYEGRKDNEFLKNGDILLNSLGGGSVGRIGFYNLKDNEYLTDGHLIIYRPNKSTNNKFLYYCLYSKQKELEDMAVGSTNQCFLNVSDIYKMPLPSPCINEQARIADFLDKKVSEIDAVISKTKESIEEYKKLKQSIITEAVTKGLDSNVEMKDSGIKEIGLISSEWKCLKIKYVLIPGEDSIKVGPFGSSIRGKMLPDGEYKVYNQAHLISGDFSLNRHFINKETYEELKQYRVIPGDILFSMMGTIGKCRVMPEGFPEGIMDSHLIKGRLNEDVVNKNYFQYAYDKDNSRIVIDQYLKGSKGTIMDGLNSTVIKNVYITLPDIKEQRQIVEYLDNQCSKYDDLISKKEEVITELEQYKKSLIYEYVTGKKEV